MASYNGPRILTTRSVRRAPSDGEAVRTHRETLSPSLLALTVRARVEISTSRNGYR